MRPHFADGAKVPCCCKWVWVWVGWLWSHSAVARSVAEAMMADFLPALDEEQADMFTA